MVSEEGADGRGKCEENFSRDEVTRFFVRSNLFVHTGSPRAIFCPMLHIAGSLSYSLRCSKNFILITSLRLFLWLFATPREILHQRFKVKGNISMKNTDLRISGEDAN